MIELPAPDEACPGCGSWNATPIVHGLPTAQAVEAADRGEIVLAGCRVSRASRAWRCRECGTRFGIPPMLRARADG
jgi:hypothetical protein